MFNTRLNNKRKYWFIITGESNSGGQALNSQAGSSELATTAAVQILNNTTNLLQSLTIGTNNVLGHSGITVGTTHGFELELANLVKANPTLFGTEVYLTKTGQGGATLLQFEVGNAAGYFNTHSTRISTMKTRLAAIGVTNYKPIIILTIGLNDIGAGTTAANFKIKLANHISNLRYNLNMGNVPVIMPDFTSMPNWTTYNTAMTELTQTIPNIYVVSSSGATLKDVSHWDCAGYKLVMQRMMNVIVTM